MSDNKFQNIKIGFVVHGTYITSERKGITYCNRIHDEMDSDNWTDEPVNCAACMHSLMREMYALSTISFTKERPTE